MHAATRQSASMAATVHDGVLAKTLRVVLDCTRRSSTSRRRSSCFCATEKWCLLFLCDRKDCCGYRRVRPAGTWGMTLAPNLFVPLSFWGRGRMTRWMVGRRHPLREKRPFLPDTFFSPSSTNDILPWLPNAPRPCGRCWFCCRDMPRPGKPCQCHPPPLDSHYRQE